MWGQGGNCSQTGDLRKGVSAFMEDKSIFH